LSNECSVDSGAFSFIHVAAGVRPIWLPKPAESAGLKQLSELPSPRATMRAGADRCPQKSYGSNGLGTWQRAAELMLRPDSRTNATERDGFSMANDAGVWRERAGLTLDQAARHIGVGKAYLRRLERHGGGYDTALKMAQLYGCDIAMLLYPCQDGRGSGSRRPTAASCPRRGRVQTRQNRRNQKSN